MKIDINNLKENYADLQTYNKIMAEDERCGNFTHDQDVVDPNTYFPVDENFPFVRKGLKWKVKRTFYRAILKIYTKKINKHLINLKVEGRENLKGIRAAIITCNHVGKVDSFAVRGATNADVMYVAAEHNNWKGPLGELARNTGYIPLPSHLRLSIMKKFNEAIKYYLSRGEKILFYPEQAMWREYKKPRPLQNGAFHYAALHNVPIVPMFITLKPKSQMVDEKGRANFSDYYIHVLPAIYPDRNKSCKENELYLKEQNACAWQEVYEKAYKKSVAKN